MSSLTSSEKNLWDQVRSHFKSKFGLNFQLQMPFTSYYWEDPKPGYISYRTYDLFNERPLWSEVRRHEDGGMGIYEAYGTVIQFSPNLVPTQNQQQQLANVNRQLRSAQDQLQKDTDASYAAFSDAKKKASAAGIILKYPTWIVNNEWASVLEQDKLLINKLVSEEADILKQYPDNTKEMAAYTPPDPSATTTDKAFLKCFIAGREFWRAIYTAPTPHDIINMMSKGGQRMSFTINSSTAITSITWAGGTRNIFDSFFSVCVNQMWKKFDLTEPGESVTVTIEFDKIDSFEIGYGSWYNGGYLANLKKQDYWAPGYSADKVFGEDGLLPLISTRFIAAIGMTISIHVSQSAFQKYRKEFLTATGVRIGSFSFGGSDGASSDKFRREAKTLTSVTGNSIMALSSVFEVQLTDQYPYVLGYLVARADGELLEEK